MTSPQHIIKIMQAYEAGKVIRFRRKDRNWINGIPNKWSHGKPFSHFEWDFNRYEYEVFEPREFWVSLDKERDVAGFAWTQSEKDKGKIPFLPEGRVLLHVREVVEWES